MMNSGKVGMSTQVIVVIVPTFMKSMVTQQGTLIIFIGVKRFLVEVKIF